MAYILAAKLVVAAHFSFIAFLFLGGLALPSRRWLAWIHAPCVAYAVLITIVGWSCPLTHLEQWLLGRAGEPVYSGEFLPHYVWSRFGLTGAELPVITALLVALVAFNFLPYRFYLRGTSKGATA